MNPSFVIDASVIVSWYSPGEQNDYAKDILYCLKNERAITPCLCYLEVNNVLRVLEKKGKIPNLSVDKAIVATDKLQIIRDSAPSCFNLPLASLDNELNNAAKAAGIKLKTP